MTAPVVDARVEFRQTAFVFPIGSKNRSNAQVLLSLFVLAVFVSVLAIVNLITRSTTAQVLRPAESQVLPVEFQKQELNYPTLENTGKPIALRITWGGGTPEIWHGEVRLRSQQLPLNPTASDSESIGTESPKHPWRRLRLMSIEPDAPGSVLIDDKNERLLIQSQRALSYNSFQIDLLTDLVDLETAVLDFKFHVPGKPNSEVAQTVSLADILQQSWHANLDTQGNGIWVERPQQDRLRIEFQSGSGQVVSPGQSIDVSVHGNYSQLKPGTEVHWQIALQADDTSAESAAWQDSGSTRIDSAGNLPTIGPLNLTSPKLPGVYQLTVTAEYAKTGMLAFSARDRMQQKYQFVVVPESRNQAAPSLISSKASIATEAIQISPQQLTSGWPRLTEVPRLGVFPRLNPLAFPATKTYATSGSGGLQLQQDSEGSWMELGGGQWRTVSVDGVPAGQYILNVKCRNPEFSRLAVSTLQADRWGNYAALQTGVGTWQQRLPWQWDEADTTLEISQQVWINPTATAHPLILVLQNSGDQPVQIGDMQLTPVPVETQNVGRTNRNHRGTSVHLETPLLATIFSAQKHAADEESSSLNDLSSYNDSVDRLCQWMNQRSIDSIWMPVLSDGGSLYPSSIYQTSLRYENSAFHPDVQFDQKIDVVQLMMKRLESEGKSLVPIFDFSGSVELFGKQRLQFDSKEAGKQQSLRWAQHSLLEPAVQQCVTEVLTDFVQRYRHHSALDGLAINLNAESPLLLKGESDGLRTEIIQRFLADHQLVWDQQKLGPLQQSSVAQREAFILGQHRNQWLRWRCSQMTNFYRQLAEQLKSVSGDPQFEVTLICDRWLQNVNLRSATLPNLRSRLDWNRESIQLGVDLAQWNQPNEPFELLFRWGAKPADQIVANRKSSFPFHQEAAWEVMPNQGNSSTVFQDPFEVLDLGNIPTPNGRQPGMQTLVNYVEPYGRTKQWSETLWRMDAKSLARDSWGLGALPSSQELAFQNSFAQLPKTDFETVFANPNCGIVLRKSISGSDGYFYVVNAAPWTTKLRINDSSRDIKITGLSNDANDVSIDWQPLPDGLHCEIQPYSIAVFRCNRFPDLGKFIVEDDPEVLARLTEVKNALFRKLKLTGQPKPWPFLVNAEFEDTTTESIPGWTTSQSDQQQIVVDDRIAYSGQQSLHVTSQGNVAWLRSQPMSPISTGRVSIAAWFRAPEDLPRTTVRLSIDGETPYGEKFYRFAEVQVGGEQAAGKWQPVAAHFDDIPEAGLISFRIGLDLMGPGEFWVDSFHCFDRWFDATDQKVLSNRLGLFAYALENRDHAFGAYQMLSDYWLNFLYAHFEDPLLVNGGDTASAESESHARPLRNKRRLFLR